MVNLSEVKAMTNFFNQHEGFKKLEKELREYNLEKDLLEVVGDAIQYGIERVYQKIIGR